LSFEVRHGCFEQRPGELRLSLSDVSLSSIELRKGTIVTGAHAIQHLGDEIHYIRKTLLTKRDLDLFKFIPPLPLEFAG
jgi:hypothetical protein